MKKNPFLKADRAVIDKLYSDTATFRYRIPTRSFDTGSGAYYSSFQECVRTINIEQPSELSEASYGSGAWSADGKNWMKGDLTARVAMLDLQAALDPVSGDPVDLSMERTADGVQSGLDPRYDIVEYGGNTYRIVKVAPANVYANIASVFKIQLREGGADGEG